MNHSVYTVLNIQMHFLLTEHLDIIWTDILYRKYLLLNKLSIFSFKRFALKIKHLRLNVENPFKPLIVEIS